jgi:hypothetical protein
MAASSNSFFAARLKTIVLLRPGSETLSPRKAEIQATSEQMPQSGKNSGGGLLRVLEIGCGSGDVLAGY